MLVEVEHQRHGIDLIKIDNDETKIIFTNYGARIVSWKYHDNNIVLGNVVEADEFYHENPFKFGATIGRYSGRIAQAQFDLGEAHYELERNEAPHHIHGGSRGLDNRVFDYEVYNEIGQIRITFTTTLKEVDDNFPGDIDVRVTHIYDANHQWTIQYEAEATKQTLFNPTNHVYFNLNRDNKVIDNHQLSSDRLEMALLGDNHIVLPDQTLDLNQIFNRQPIVFSDIFTNTYQPLQQQMELCGGLDHPFHIDGKLIVDNKQFALEVTTDMPQVVIFTFNSPSEWQSDFNIYKAHSGFTLETQYMPNDINMYGEQAGSILQPHQPFVSKTSYRIQECPLED